MYTKEINSRQTKIVCKNWDKKKIDKFNAFLLPKYDKFVKYALSMVYLYGVYACALCRWNEDLHEIIIIFDKSQAKITWFGCTMLQKKINALLT